jgi:transcription elongation GreA/GreB family factor
MSVAFTREESAETAAEVTLPDRLISQFPNFVTSSGLQGLENALSAARSAYEAAQQIDDVNERRRIAAPAVRDVKYFSERLRTAQTIAPPTAIDVVAFGTRISFRRDDGPSQVFRIVGEDEADPRNGSISYVSPVARVLIGKAVGEVVSLGEHQIEILEISVA